MPRYFFHIHDGTAVIDPDGVELPGADDAREKAVEAAAEALHHLGPRFWESGKWLMRATDENGNPICLITFSGELAP